MFYLGMSSASTFCLSPIILRISSVNFHWMSNCFVIYLRRWAFKLEKTYNKWKKVWCSSVHLKVCHGLQSSPLWRPLCNCGLWSGELQVELQLHWPTGTVLSCISDLWIKTKAKDPWQLILFGIKYASALSNAWVLFEVMQCYCQRIKVAKFFDLCYHRN